ncbi:MAG: threonine synthase [Actinomycetota bacterium]
MSDVVKPTGSTLSHLEGSLSGRRYDPERLMRLDPSDGKPLLAHYDLAAAARTLTPAALSTRTGGMWRWAELLPVRDPRYITHLGEGDTPLLAAPALGAELGAPRLLIKSEGLNPTGSFKARGMAAAVSRAVELGATSFIAPSAGNAAGALAAYGAAAGKPVMVVMPVDAPESNRAEVLTCGASLILVAGHIGDCGRVASALAERAGAFDVSTLKEPYRVEGKKTMGLELAEQLGWRLPDVVVYPTGGGTGLVGMWKAFEELERLELIGPQRPRMVAVQAEGCAPIVRAFERGDEFAEPWSGAATRAAGLRVPSAVGDFLILRAVRDSRGAALAVSEDAISDTQLLAGRKGAGYVSPESAAAFAGVRALAEGGFVEGDDEIVVFDTGVGHKYDSPAGPAEPPTVDPDDFDPERLLETIRATTTLA